VAPLWLGGLRGKKSTPSIGWEVPVKSHRLASGSRIEHAWDNDSELSPWAMVHMHLFEWYIIIVLALSLLYFYCVKKCVLLNVFNRELKVIIALRSLLLN
jgi:hypothetical protein